MDIKVEPSSAETQTQGHVEMQFLAKTRRLAHKPKTTFTKARARYKRYFDKQVRPQAPVNVGYRLYL